MEIFFLFFLIIIFCSIIDSSSSLSSGIQLKKYKSNNLSHMNRRIVRSTELRKASESLINDFNIYYIANISLGTPPQYFEVLIDTAAFNTWVPSTKCIDDIGILCSGKDLYDHEKSETNTPHNINFTIDYGDSKFTIGSYSTDTLSLGSVKVQDFFFVEANIFDYTTDFDGVLALGFNEDFYDPVSQMYADNLIDRNVFSIYVNRNQSNDFGGELFIGGNNPNYYNGNLVYVDLTDENYWQFNIFDITASRDFTEDEYLCTEYYCGGIIASGYPFIYGPQDAIDKLNAELGFAMDGSIDCSLISSLPYVDFVIEEDGPILSLSPYDYVIQDFGCYTGFYGDTDFWIFGGIFLGAFYTEFNSENLTIGFAPTKGSKSKIKESTNLDTTESTSTTPKPTIRSSNTQRITTKTTNKGEKIYNRELDTIVLAISIAMSLLC